MISPRATLCRLGISWLVLLAGSATPLDATGHEVLIYYANATEPDSVESASYDTIVTWLATAGDARLQRMADRINRDRQLFPAVVDWERQAIESAAEGSALDLGIVILTNGLSRRGLIRVRHPGGRGFTEQRFEFPKSDLEVLHANPLADANVFSAVLRRVAEIFPPSDHRFVLVTKSHGSKTHAVMPRLAILATDTDRDTILATASGSAPQSDRAPWDARIGISKQLYLETLGRAGVVDGMRFEAVVMESCHGAIDFGTLAEWTANVQRLFVIDRVQADYVNALYGDLIARAGPSDSLGGLLLEALPGRFTVLGRPGTKPRETTGRSGNGMPWHWVPFIAWVAAVVGARIVGSPPEKEWIAEPTVFQADAPFVVDECLEKGLRSSGGAG
jgi:hypothetical protein